MGKSFSIPPFSKGESHRYPNLLRHYQEVVDQEKLFSAISAPACAYPCLRSNRDRKTHLYAYNVQAGTNRSDSDFNLQNRRRIQNG